MKLKMVASMLSAMLFTHICVDVRAESLYEVALNKSSWLGACEDLRGLQSLLHGENNPPQKSVISVGPSSSALAIEIAGVSFPLLSGPGRLVSLIESGGSVDLSFHSGDAYVMVYESGKRRFIHDFWSENGESRAVEGYEVSDSSELTNLVFDGPASDEEVLMDSLTATPSAMLCTEETLFSDIRLYLALLQRDQSIENQEEYLLTAGASRGFSRIENFDQYRRLTVYLFDAARYYSLTYRYPSTDSEFESKLLRAIGIDPA